MAEPLIFFLMKKNSSRGNLLERSAVKVARYVLRGGKSVTTYLSRLFILNRFKGYLDGIILPGKGTDLLELYVRRGVFLV